MVDWEDILDSRQKQLKIVFSNTNVPLVSIIMIVQKNTLSFAIKKRVTEKVSGINFTLQLSIRADNNRLPAWN